MISRVGDGRVSPVYLGSRIGRVHTGRKFEPWEDVRRFGGQDRIVTEHYPVSEEELRNLTEGECVIIKPKSWVKCRLIDYENATAVIDKVLSG